MSAQPELIPQEPQTIDPMAMLYENYGFSADHSLELNVMLAAARRTSQPGELPRAEMAAELCAWYDSVEQECSWRFQELRTTNPAATKAELNADPELLAVNTLRRAIRHQRGLYTR